MELEAVIPVTETAVDISLAQKQSCKPEIPAEEKYYVRRHSPLPF